MSNIERLAMKLNRLEGGAPSLELIEAALLMIGQCKQKEGGENNE